MGGSIPSMYSWSLEQVELLSPVPSSCSGSNTSMYSESQRSSAVSPRACRAAESRRHHVHRCHPPLIQVGHKQVDAHGPSSLGPTISAVPESHVSALSTVLALMLAPCPKSPSSRPQSSSLPHSGRHAEGDHWDPPPDDGGSIPARPPPRCATQGRMPWIGPPGHDQISTAGSWGSPV